MKYIIIAFITTAIVCQATGMAAQTHAPKTAHVAGVPALIYKTRKDYRKLVPVILSDDKKQVISYPDPSDLMVGGAYTLPTQLHKGYLLDNRGINQHVAFLKWTYAEYAALKQPPPQEELYKNIADKNPLTKFYNCGLKRDPKNAVKHLNSLIDKNQLKANCTIQ